MGELNTFPLSYKVEGQRIVIIGGGEEALNKARLVTKTTALVVIISRHISSDFPGLSIERVERAFVPADLDSTALVFVAETGVDAELAKSEARRRGIPLNVVDVPAECDFFTPSFIERAPITIAVSSEGDAPVLARLLRARIEADLPPRVGTLARLAGSLRERVEALIPSNAARRRFYETLVTSPEIDTALSRSTADGRRVALGLLDTHATEATGQGFVHLIGAGPGAEDLLTLRAQRLLQEADVIVHDQLVPNVVVEMGRRDAQRICVGKSKGSHSISQHQINHLLVTLAREGKRVARLKSGDPLIFGRAGEELAALRREGIPHAVVPGITAALAAAADTATPVTLRNVASGFLVATAHGADDSEVAHWAAIAGQGLTLGIYMGKSVAADVAARLIAAGMSAATPVGVVVNAGRPNRSLHFGQLGELSAGISDIAPGPALILIGEAVAAGDWSAATALAERTSQVA
ncbi:MAG: cobA [Devosia sp.]|nr:cobA [Devosia sp.]